LRTPFQVGSVIRKLWFFEERLEILRNLKGSGFLIIKRIIAPQPAWNARQLEPQGDVIGTRIANLSLNRLKH
jgi:hypothetical protein